MGLLSLLTLAVKTLCVRQDKQCSRAKAATEGEMETKYYKLGNGGGKMKNRNFGSAPVINGMKVRLINLLQKQPGHVQLCLVLALSTLIISLFLDRRDLAKTILFYVITAGGCTLCDWKYI